MKLRHSATSPYVRKVCLLAIEAGLMDQIELVATNPWDAETDLPKDNPMGKVPALILADGTVFAGSGLICEYLDSLHEAPKLFPEQGPERWAALRVHAIADGISDATINHRIETVMRPGEVIWEDWAARQNGVINRCLDRLEALVGDFKATPDIGQIATASSLGYLDLRREDLGWRTTRPKLAAWFERFSARESMQETRPPEG